MKVVIFEGNSMDIESNINDWLKEDQPTNVEFQMVHLGKEEGMNLFTVLAKYEPSFAEKD